MRTKRCLPLLLVLASLTAAVSGCVGTIDSRDDDLDGTDAMLASGKGVVRWPTESTDELVNPERGYYVGYDLVAARDASWVREDGYALAIALVDLGDYRASALPSSLLEQLGAGFAQARAAGIKLIVRFTYNSAFDDDAPLARVLGHIGQLAPVLRANEDVIAVVQAGFVGAWGEWHASTNGLTDPSARHDIIAALLDAVPASRSVQLRKPSFKRDFVDGAVDAGEAFSGSARARLGHHNDCFLASDNDLNTYDAPVASSKQYVADDTAYVPMGGETCKVYLPRSGCESALAEMGAHHWSYLNREYHASVIGGFVSGGCDGTIRRSLGYRFAATRVAHSARVAPGGVLALQVDVANRGFAVPMNERPVEVVLVAGGVRKVARLDYDARHLAAGETTTIAARLRVPADLAPGTYSLALRLPDAVPSLAADPRYAIQLANSGGWDAATGDNVIAGELSIAADAPGERDDADLAFHQL